jgi:hypothetical protein
MDSFIFNHLWFEASRKCISTIITVCCGKNTTDLTVCEFLKFCCRKGGFSQIIDQ